MSDAGLQSWRSQPERGVAWVMRACVVVALTAGRGVMRLFVPLIALYFTVAAGSARRASRAYLARVLPRPPGLFDVWRHFATFGAVILDRVYLLNDELKRFDVAIHGEESVLDVGRRGKGCLLLGAHFGSFEILRAAGRRHAGLRVSLGMFEENARKISAALTAINPGLNMDVIALGRADSMTRIEQRLREGAFVGLLADRGLTNDRLRRRAFLGAEAGFPLGPFRVASMLDVPVVFMFGIYRGGRRYEVLFETATEHLGADASHSARGARLLDHYAERLEFHCRDAPFNWFNFYDFWR
ncbi:MAG: acyl-CoA synthetase [Rhodospirillales bacterium]|nr:acyl-CoA synthetase [Rhodospirillales bacterium]